MGGGEEDSERPAKRAKTDTQATPAAPAPVEKKKLTIKKAVAESIHQINAMENVSVPIRLGAVAGALAQVGELAALDVLAKLAEEIDEVEDPNEFIQSQVQLVFEG